MLTYNPELPSSAYAQLLVTVDHASASTACSRKPSSGWPRTTRTPNLRRSVSSSARPPGPRSRRASRVTIRRCCEISRNRPRRSCAPTPTPRMCVTTGGSRFPSSAPVYAETRARQRRRVSRPDLAGSLQIVDHGKHGRVVPPGRYPDAHRVSTGRGGAFEHRATRQRPGLVLDHRSRPCRSTRSFRTSRPPGKIR